MTSAEPATRPPHDLDGDARVIRLDYVAFKGLLWVKRSGSKAIERMTANGALQPVADGTAYGRRCPKPVADRDDIERLKRVQAV